MKNTLKEINTANFYKLQKDIDEFILENERKIDSIKDFKKSISEMIIALFNRVTITLYFLFFVLCFFFMRILKWLTTTTFLNSVHYKLLLVTLLLLFLGAVVIGLLAIISSPVYYNYKFKILENFAKKKRIKEEKKQINNLQEYLKREDKSQYKTVNQFSLELSGVYSLLELNLKEEELRMAVEERKSKTDISITFWSLFFVLFSIGLFDIIFEVQVEKLIDDFNFYGFGFVLFINVVFSITLKWFLLNSLKFQKQALSAIKKAQIIIKETKFKEKVDERY